MGLIVKPDIKFFESLLKHLNGNDEGLKSRAMWASWCLHTYLNNGLILDIQKAMKEHGGDNDRSA